jgi:hypothetical protein
MTRTAAPHQTPRAARSRTLVASRVPTFDEKERPVARVNSQGRANSPVRAGAKRAAAWAAAATSVAVNRPRLPPASRSRSRRPRSVRNAADANAAAASSGPSVDRRSRHTTDGPATLRTVTNKRTETAAPATRQGRRPAEPRTAVSEAVAVAIGPLPLDHFFEEAPVDRGEIGDDARKPYQGADDDENDRENQ